MRLLAAAALLLTTACAAPPAGLAPASPGPAPAPTTAPTVEPAAAPAPGPRRGPQRIARDFVEVVERVEPVAERACRSAGNVRDCDFAIFVDDTPGAPANAFQTVDRAGRPVIVFTLSLLEDTRNADEIAFVLAHEAAHHIEGHLDRQRLNAQIGATVFGRLAGELGGPGGAQSAEGIARAQEIGALVGARSYSRDFELEADVLGTRITEAAGYDALRGAAFFFRIPDPGDRFLGTHPPNAQRLQAVRATVAAIR
ncbi:MAG: M48 family metallopeptidase [Paracoccaceae bacterium]